MQAAQPGGAPASGPLRLEVLSGKAAGFTIIVDERMVIGRHSEGPGRLADDPELSRHHAAISRQPAGGFVIDDLSSTNGTFVNGTRLEAPMALGRGDKIDVGATTIIVREAPPRSRAPEPEPASRGPADVDVRATTTTINEPPRKPPESERAPEQPPPEPEPHVDALPERVGAVEPPTEAHEPAPRGKPPLELRVIVDLDQAEARVALDGEGDALRLRFVDGRWRVNDGGG